MAFTLTRRKKGPVLAVALILAFGWLSVMPESAHSQVRPYKHRNSGDNWDRAILFIDDNPGFEVSVLSDGRAYEDSSIAPDSCVTAMFRESGFFWVDILRPVKHCREPRTYFIEYPAGTGACGLLFGNDESPCKINAQCPSQDCRGNARIRVQKIFSTDGETQASFVFTHTNRISYEVRTDREVVVSIRGATIIVSNYSTASLWMVAGSAAKPASRPFEFPFQLQVERSPGL